MRVHNQLQTCRCSSVIKASKMRKFVIVTIFLVAQVLGTHAKKMYTIDERWVCNIKTSCLDCLQLSHCTWCQESNKCFSSKLPNSEDFCKDNATHYVDYGLSFHGNAQCACTDDSLDRNCYPPGVSEGPECSNRGKCECGRCACDELPDPEHPTKKIVGEYCEFDNFSCDGPRCNEGPYYIHQLDDDLE